MENPERLIGRKVKGFKFEEFNHAGFTKTMESFIGKVGIIESYNKNTNCFLVRFDVDDFKQWAYPSDQIESHLVEDEIPTLSDGVMMLVGNSLHKLKPRKVLFKKNGLHYAFVSDAEVIVLGYQFCKPLEPTKEEQLAEILGSSEKVSEIMELFKK